jgi:Zn-dependent peptidase ImmA (M78 family)/DNA-binding XRE family transcriptional regulator
MNMKKGLAIKTNCEVLTALREFSGYTIDEIAKKLKASKEKIKATEEGNVSFTLTQIKKLAAIYHRPLAAFFTNAIPAMPEIKDYRINRNKRLTPQVYIAERRAYYLSNKLAELTDKRSHMPSFPETLQAEELAQEFRRHLRMELLKSKKSDELLAQYKQVLEENFLMSIIELPLKADDVRGFNILADISVIVLNEGDKPSIKLFSLFHEVCHLIKRKSGICSIEVEQKDEDIEPFCNLFSAEFLVPSEDLKREYEKFSQLDENAISELSKIYGVSKQVLMLRLLWSGYIDNERYSQFKQVGVKKQKEKMFGRRNWDKVFQNRVGDLAIKETASAYRTGKISYSEVFDILNMKAKYIEKFVER